jgi:hypothetical protein
MDRTSAELAGRVGRLERGVRRDRLIVSSVLVLAVATAQTQTPPAPVAGTTPIVVRDASGASATLSARGLVVRDSAGKERIAVGLDSSAFPGVDLSDATGQLRESMYLLNNIPVLRQFDAAGKRRMEMGLTTNNEGQLLLNDQNEKLRLALFRTTSGDPEMGLYGTDEKLRAYFATDDASPYLVMRDAGATTRVYLGGYTDGSIGMDVRNSGNTVLWKAP